MMATGGDVVLPTQKNVDFARRVHALVKAIETELREESDDRALLRAVATLAVQLAARSLS